MELIYGERLGPQNPAIRILTLLPGPSVAGIECSLTRVTFDKATSYEAVSYAWGDPSDKSSISVNGSQLSIPSNLSELLKYLRKPDDCLALWADAVCINQEDVEEKNYQVSIMGHIFQQCTSAYIWLGVPKSLTMVDSTSLDDFAFKTVRWVDNVLGTSDEAIEPAMDPFILINHFAHNKHLFELPCFEIHSGTGQMSFRQDPTFEAIWNAFKDAFEKPWWSRFWCIQECLLPASATVMLGPWKIPWRTIKLCEMNYKRHVYGCCATSAGLLPAEYAFYVDAVVANSTMDSSHGPSYHPALPDNLDHLLRNFRYKTCQNPRDKIYGIFGLLNQSRYPQLVLDYSLSIGQVYTNAMTAALCDGSGDLRCLTGTGFNSGAHQLPSWVRNFEACPGIATVNAETARYELYSLYNACSSSTASPVIQNATDLVLNGVCIDHIQKVGRVNLDRDWAHVRDVLDDWLELANISLSRNHTIETFVGHHNLSFWRTIAGDTAIDHVFMGRRLTGPNLYDYGRWLYDMFGATEHRRVPPMDAWVRSLVANIHGRAMFVSEKGHIGLCYPESQPGDEVWVLDGGRVPFILRSNRAKDLDTSITGASGGYKFIGESYLHGFMDGEIFENLAAPDRICVVLH